MTTTDKTGVTRELAQFIFRTTFEDAPKEAIDIAKRCVVDGAAVILAGSLEPCAQILRTYAKQTGGAAEATTLGAASLTAPAQLAALVNGTAGHALDWDDTALSMEKDRSVLIHPTMQPLCAGLAVGELVGASGRDFLTAFVLGFETSVKIAEAISAEHFTGGRGFHTSGTIGVFAAAAAASKLMRLSEPEIVNALAIAATMASGIGANHGTMSKPLNMGLASEKGVTAARLAHLGFDGNTTALEAGRGFFEAFGGGFDPSKISGRLGDPFAILVPGTSIKPYPSGVVGHPGMDALRELVNAHDIRPEEVAEIFVKTGANTIAPGPLRIQHATSALEAKFCVPFQMAAILLRRKAGLSEFSDPFVQSEACQALQKRVRAVVDPEIAARGKDKVVFDITVATHDGRTFRGVSAEHYRGGPRNPLSWAEVCAKFEDCADPVLSRDAQAGFLELVASLETLDASTRLTSLLAQKVVA